MELYLSGSMTNDEYTQMEEQGVLFLLQTFYEMKSWKEEKVNRTLNCCDTFMLDSGAFTFMNSGKKVHWKTYVDEYIEFINKYDIQHFIELDLYEVLGAEKTEKIRRYIEHHTGKKPIPVYHGTMPVSYFRMLCQKYPYVAVSATGTIESSKWTKNKQALKQIISLVMIALSIALPVAPFANNQSEFTSIMGSSFRVVFASMIAYLCSQSWDVFFFHKVRNWYIAKHGTTKGGKWIWNNGSTMTSQIIDTAIFITIAFYGTVPNIFVMMFSQYLIKFIYAALDTPFFYFLTRNSDKQNI